MEESKKESAYLSCCIEAGAQQWKFEATGTCLVFNPEKQMLHLHFGDPTIGEEESTAQAKFVNEHVVNTIYTEHKGKTFFIIADFARLDDSAAPSKDALRLYAEIIKHEQTGKVICHGMQTGMRGIIHVLAHTPKMKGKIAVVDSATAAEEKYTQWAKEHLSI